ncbi:hypothetical protein BDN67DRAFT_1011878 [Paxillus ammoniavirescens]|nr:hypothetical protein BDN67DRAFT_1011878 [Paxillus ammoniavirescens]
MPELFPEPPRAFSKLESRHLGLTASLVALLTELLDICRRCSLFCRGPPFQNFSQSPFMHARNWSLGGNSKEDTYLLNGISANVGSCLVSMNLHGSFVSLGHIPGHFPASYGVTSVKLAQAWHPVDQALGHVGPLSRSCPGLLQA